MIPARWSTAFALALLLHLPVLRMAVPATIEEAQWLSGPGRGAGVDTISVYDLYLVTARSRTAATGSADPPIPAVVTARINAAENAESPEQAAATPEPAPAPLVREAGGSGRDTYYARLRAHLQRYRRPIQAAAAGAHTVVVRFRVDGGGGVSAIGLERSCGDALLDAEALDLVRRAAPVPPPPRRLAKNLAVPIEFE